MNTNQSTGVCACVERRVKLSRKWTKVFAPNEGRQRLFFGFWFFFVREYRKNFLFFWLLISHSQGRCRLFCVDRINVNGLWFSKDYKAAAAAGL
jgi:hypothetical protein